MWVLFSFIIFHLWVNAANAIHWWYIWLGIFGCSKSHVWKCVLSTVWKISLISLASISALEIIFLLDMGLVKLRVKITIIVLCPVNQYSCIRAGPSSQEADLQIYLLSTTVYLILMVSVWKWLIMGHISILYLQKQHHSSKPHIWKCRQGISTCCVVFCLYWKYLTD